jgi:hypothetical protein
VVLLPQARPAVVAAAGRDCGVVEGVDRRPVGAGERDVRAASERLALGDPELGLLARPEARRLPLGELQHDAVPERRERALEERPARCVVPNVEADVIEHQRSPSPW